MLLTDIAVEHTLASKNGGPRETLFLHPFTNTQRDSLGKFEIVRSVRKLGDKEVKCSTFVSFQHLAELYAKGVLEEFGFSVRMCAAGGKHPGTNPVKKYSQPVSNLAHRSTWLFKASIFQNQLPAN